MRKALTVFLMLLVLVAGGYSGYEAQGHVFRSNFVQVVGKRAEFLLYENGQAFNKDFDSQPFYATVTFTHDGRFIASGHSCPASTYNNNYYGSGVGYFKENQPYSFDKETNTVDFSFRPDLADLVVKKNDGGLYGKVRHPLAGTPVRVGQPQIGPATVLLSNTTGADPSFVKAYVVNDGKSDPGRMFTLVFPDEQIIPGNSGSPVVQLQGGQLCLIGAVSTSITGDNGSSSAGRLGGCVGVNMSGYIN